MPGVIFDDLIKIKGITISYPLFLLKSVNKFGDIK